MDGIESPERQFFEGSESFCNRGVRRKSKAFGSSGLVLQGAGPCMCDAFGNSHFGSSIIGLIPWLCRRRIQSDIRGSEIFESR
jgi:hypothetical protein